MELAVHILVALFLTATLASGLVQGTDFFSSLVQDSRTSACLGETVTYVCIVPDPTGGARDTRWNGTLFQCPTATPPDAIFLDHEDFIVSGTVTGTCGDLTAEIVSQIGTGADSEFNSTLPVTAIADLDGRTVVCSGPGASVGQFGEIGSATLTLAPLPAPTITVTELTPESVRVSVTCYPEESERCITNFTVEETSGTGEMAFSESGLSVDFSLDLCTSTYTFVGQVMGNSVDSPMSPSVEFGADLRTLDPVTNVRTEDESQTLLWDVPANAPDNCIVNYQIAVDGFSTFTTTTDDNSTSFSLSSFSLTTCEEYFVTVAPITVRIGVVETSRSDPPYRLISAHGFPLPTITSVDFVYRQQDIMVTISWQGEGMESESFIDSVFVECESGGMAVCSPVNITDATGRQAIELTYSDVIGEDVNFTVSFVNLPCQTRDTMTANFPNLMESARAMNVDRTSADILVMYNNDVVVEGNFMLLANAAERDTGRFPQSQSEMFPPPPTTGTENQFVFMFTGLMEGITYEFEVRVENGLGQTIGRVESGTLTTVESEEDLNTGGITVVTVVIVTVVSSLLSFATGVVVGGLVCYWFTRKERKSQCVSCPKEQARPSVYEDVGPPRGDIEMKENVAYGPVRSQ